MENQYLIVGLVIIFILVGGFFAFRFIKNQLYELKLDLLNTIREREKMEGQSIKEGTRMISIKTEHLNDNEVHLLVGKISHLRGVLNSNKESDRLIFTIDLLRKNEITDEIESFRRETGMNFFVD